MRAIAMMRKATILAASLALTAGMAGCRVHVDKDASGNDKTVQVDTPFGGVHVNTDQTTAADLGLPVYPGAQMVAGDDKHKSADVHLGFGEWELRVRAVSYSTPDNNDKVTEFYKKALSRYGDVLVCRNNAPQGKKTATSEGLTCDDDKDGKVQVGKGDNVNIDTGSEWQVKLMAGSKRHQHIVGFEAPKDGNTRFALVALDLPAFADSDSGKSD
jgi:hypothetical protein